MEGKVAVTIKLISVIKNSSNQASPVVDINGEVIVLHEWEKKKPRVVFVAPATEQPLEA